jgi:tetratricopeptide (TPR) repeat protein
MKFSAISVQVLLLAILTTVAPVRAQSVSNLMAKGDVADRAHNPALALQSYLPAEKMDPNNVKLLLRISRQYRHLMSDTGNKATKIKYGRVALTYDTRLAKLAPRDSDAQLSVAITYGKMIPLLGKKEQVAASPRIKAAADKALKLNPRNDTAWHVLGRWNQGLAKISGLKRKLGGMLYGKLPTGTYKESVRCFNKAIAIDPKRLRNYIELGCTYSLAGQPEYARKCLKKGLSLPSKEKDDPSIKAKGRAVLAKLG